MENWKQITNTNYEVSTQGRIRNNITNKILKQQISKKGYLMVTLRIANKNKTLSVARLVGKNYIPNESSKPQINHISGIKTDNRVENLEWCTNLENQIHARKNGLVKNKKGAELSFSKQINQYDLQGNFIKTWESIQSTRVEYNYQNIWKCCKNKRQTANGFIWKYATI